MLSMMTEEVYDCLATIHFVNLASQRSQDESTYLFQALQEVRLFQAALPWSQGLGGRTKAVW
jgi:hypothetical protein